MRTITEFYGRTLKAFEEKIPSITEEATKTATEALKAEGKSEEETTAALPAAVKAAVDAKLAEEAKVEGDKLAMMLAAIEAVKGARGGVLKRVVVMAPNEGEKAPSAAKEIDGKFYLVEFFPEATKAPARQERGGRDGKRGGRDGKRGRGGRDGKGRGRGPRRDAPPGFVAEGSGGDARSSGGDARASEQHGAEASTGERRPRRERKPRTPIEPYVGPNRIVLKGASTTSAPAVAESTAPATDATSSSEPTSTSTDGTH